MSRMEEYQNIMQELECPVPGLEHTLDRALKRAGRNAARLKVVTRPIMGLAAVFVIFVVLVNYCTPVAYACSKVPIIRELAEAVTFSRSLTDAVNHEYVQPLNLMQVDGDVKASVEYLIVDQKQVNVFYRLDSEGYTHMNANPVVLNADGEHLPCSYGVNEWDVPNGELQSVTIDFIDEDVPDALRLKLNIQDFGAWQREEIVAEFGDGAAENADDMAETADGEAEFGDGAAQRVADGDERALENAYSDILFEEHEEPTDYVARFDFLLEFDPEFTAAGKKFEINHTVTMDGQAITITNMEVYPTHLRVNIADTPDNTAWLKGLDFYIETDWGMKFDPVSNGITATGSADSPNFVSFRADSTYFYEAKHLKIVITGAEWLNKDMEKVYVNLKTGETGKLPEGVTLSEVSKKAQGWILEFKGDYRKANHHHQLFMPFYYDGQGNKYNFNSWTTRFGEENEKGEITFFYETFPLKNYPYEEVWLTPCYSHVWEAEDPIAIIVQ